MIEIIWKNTKQKSQKIHDAAYNPALSQLYEGNYSHFIRQLPQGPLFDLVITFPPYNIGKAHEIGKTMPLENYISWQEGTVRSIYPLLKENGSISGRQETTWNMAQSYLWISYSPECSINLTCSCATASYGPMAMACTAKRDSADATKSLRVPTKTFNIAYQMQKAAYKGTDFNPFASPKFFKESRTEYTGL